MKNNKKTKNIGAFGFSLGGAAAIMAKNKDIKAIVADSTYASLDRMVNQQYRFLSFLKFPFVFMTRIYGILFLGIDINKVSPLNDIKDIGAPILLIHAEKDSQIPAENSILLNKSAKNSELWIVGNADHGETHAIMKEKYEQRILGFFESNLK